MNARLIATCVAFAIFIFGESSVWAGDTKAPVLKSATINGSRVTLIYNEKLRAASPAPSSFSLFANTLKTKSSDTKVSGRKLIITFPYQAWSDDITVLTYEPSKRPIRDITGNKAKGFTREPVNISPIGYSPRLLEPAFAQDTSVPEPWVGEWGPKAGTLFLRPKSSINGLIVPVDFPDVPASDPTSFYRDILEPPAEAWFHEISHGRTEFNLTTLDTWTRMSLPVADYGLENCCPSQKVKAFMQEAISHIDPNIDFTTVDVLFMVGPKESGADLNILLFRPWPGDGVVADGKELRFGVVGNGNFRPGEEGLLAHHMITHEMGHLLGLPDLYGRTCPTCSAGFEFAGPWDNMSSDLLSPHLFAWHKWLLGWIDADQVRGLTEPGNIEVTLTPGEITGGLKSIVIPLSGLVAYVVEVRQPLGEDTGMCDAGVLVWRVDSSVHNASGNAEVMTDNPASDPAKLDTCGPKYDAPYDIGPEEVSVFNDQINGISVEVVEEHPDGSYLVRATRT